MSEKSTTAKYSKSDIRAMLERDAGKTSLHAPESESLGEDFWKSAKVVMPRGKTSVHLRLDSDIVEWFRERGKGHLSRMNSVLRAYVDTQNRSA